MNTKRTTALLLAANLISTTAYAALPTVTNWVDSGVIGDDDGASRFIDSRNIERKGQWIRFWMSFHNTKTDNNLISNYSINCSSDVAYVREAYSVDIHGNVVAGGKALKSEQYLGRMQPQSIMSLVKSKLCPIIDKIPEAVATHKVPAAPPVARSKPAPTAPPVAKKQAPTAPPVEAKQAPLVDTSPVAKHWAL